MPDDHVKEGRATEGWAGGEHGRYASITSDGRSAEPIEVKAE
jgi:hypothetical protein